MGSKDISGIISGTYAGGFFTVEADDELFYLIQQFCLDSVSNHKSQACVRYSHQIFNK